MKKMKFLVPIFLVFGCGLIYIFSTRASSSGETYVQINCSIYDRNSNLLFLKPAELCVFLEDGAFLASMPNKRTLRFFDSEDSLIWAVPDILVHHQLKLTSDKKSLLALSSEHFLFEGTEVRSDCVSRRGLAGGALEAEWCLKDHLKEMQDLGFSFELKPDHFMKGSVAQGSEISHANSIYEIPENLSSQNRGAFRKGNYLLNLYGSSYALLILDQDMKKILWSKDMKHFASSGDTYMVNSHDLQVTEEGNILAFFNSLIPMNGKHCRPEDQNQLPCSAGNARLVEFDPFSGILKWVYTRDGFIAGSFGTVSRLQDRNYLYSRTFPDGTPGPGEVSEINSDGKVVWQLNTAKVEEKNQIRVAQPLRPGFLISRDLISR